MKAIVYKQFGNADVLQTIEEAKPVIQSNEVLIKVKAFSINPMDWKIRKGEMKLMSGSKFPKHTGADFSGIVEEVGSSVTGLQKGDEVFGTVKNTMKDGASAEYLAVTPATLWKKPADISFTQAASIPIVGAAAATALEKMGKISSQSTILVNGATGGFGMFLLQLLKQQNAQVSAVAGSNTLKYAKEWGADTLIDYSKVNVLTQKNKYDIVIDLSGKMGYKNAKQIMNASALFINPTPKPIEIPLSLFKNLFTRKKHVIVLSAPSQKNMELLLDAIRNGLQVEINKVFPLESFKEAYQYAEKGGFAGKVVVEFN
ncbi:NADP-dependent oxidoreductase [Fluviicola sp.]|uniref:NADP-dependent oxidoreductase n=1 Tax=Fluviicola sp. TaxID=1917219 RepID=UPI0031D4E023